MRNQIVAWQVNLRDKSVKAYVTCYTQQKGGALEFLIGESWFINIITTKMYVAEFVL